VDKVLLIDFNNAVWRASIGFAPKKAPPPIPVADEWEMYGKEEKVIETKRVDDSFIIIFNFFRNLRPLIEQFSPDKCFAVLEGHPKFRYDLFADYKANRIIKQASQQESRDKFNAAHPEIVRLLQHLPITLACAVNYEADDTIGALCDNMKDEKLTVLTNDSDYIQLLQRGYKDITIYNPIKKEVMVAPEYPYVAWKCLAGDKSDNIPALLKPKKAMDAANDPVLFKKFMDIEENRANFNINRQLIEFHSIPEEEIVLQEGIRNFGELKKEFAKMEFQSIINEKSWEKYIKTFDCLRY
jgi:5'-3' exonuclease